MKLSCTRLSDLLGYFITSPINHLQPTASILNDFSSHHSPVLLTLDILSTIVYPKPKIINGLVNWECFQTHLEQKHNVRIPLKTTTEIDEALQLFTNAIQTSIWEATITNNTKRYHGLLTIPTELRMLINTRKRARAQ